MCGRRVKQYVYAPHLYSKHTVKENGREVQCRICSPHFQGFASLCGGTISVLWNCNDLLRFDSGSVSNFPSFGPGSGSSSVRLRFRLLFQYLAQLSNNNKFVQNIAFPILEAVLFPRKFASHL
jgi:hypothetical protein